MTFDEAQVKPYFELDKVLRDGVFLRGQSIMRADL